MRLRKTIWALLAMAFGCLGAGKFIGGHLETYLLPAGLYYSVGVVEIVLAVALLAGFVVVPSLVGMAIAVGGFVLALLYPDRSCGCFGIFVKASPQEHLVLAGAIAALCGLSLLLRWSAPRSSIR